MRHVAGKGTPATALLAKQKVIHRVHTYDHGGGQAYGPEAARMVSTCSGHASTSVTS